MGSTQTGDEIHLNQRQQRYEWIRCHFASPDDPKIESRIWPEISTALCTIINIRELLARYMANVIKI
jgi:hypothetical protein